MGHPVCTPVRRTCIFEKIEFYNPMINDEGSGGERDDILRLCYKVNICIILYNSCHAVTTPNIFQCFNKKLPKNVHIKKIKTTQFRRI